MPRPDARLHATHDQELVAAYAAGDATGRELAAAEALVAGCPACATLHRDLRAIMAALPAVSTPARPRDFRLTPEVAATLRPSRLRRLLAPFGSARFAFAGPAGAGLAALGLAGILLSGGLGPVLPQLGGVGSTATSAKAPEPAPVASGPLDMAYGSGAFSNAAGGGTAGGTGALPDASAAASAAAVLAPLSAPSAAPSTAPSVAASGTSRDAATQAAPPEPPAPVPSPIGNASPLAPRPADSPLPLISAAAVTLGILLVVLRIVARRVARAG